VKANHAVQNGSKGLRKYCHWHRHYDLVWLLFPASGIVPERKPLELSADDQAALAQLRELLAVPRLAAALRALGNESVDPLAKFLQQTDNLYFGDTELQRSLEDLRRRTEKLRSKIVSKEEFRNAVRDGRYPLMVMDISMMLPVYWARLMLDFAVDRLKALIGSQKF
jgi:hypothetical protein